MTVPAATPEYVRGFSDGYHFAAILADEAWRAQHGLPIEPRRIQPPDVARSGGEDR